MRWILFVLGLATPVGAEPLPDLFDVLAEIDGREVQVEGLLGQFDGFGPTLRTEKANFSLTYALPREKLKAAEECKLSIFPTDQECSARVYAEVRLGSSSIELLVFDVEFLE